jgi:hypothetical protein
MPPTFCSDAAVHDGIRSRGHAALAASAWAPHPMLQVLIPLLTHPLLEAAAASLQLPLHPARVLVLNPTLRLPFSNFLSNPISANSKSQVALVRQRAMTH